MSRRPEILDRIPELDADKDFFNDIDVNKIILIIRQNIIWILLLNILSFAAAVLYLRYTKPVYQSMASIKLAYKNEESAQVLQGIVTSPAAFPNLMGEVELLRSEIILEQVVAQLQLTTSYHIKGNILDQEIYPQAPFTIQEFSIRNGSWYGKPIEIRFLNNTTFELSYKHNGTTNKAKYRFGEWVDTPHFKFKVKLNSFSADYTTQLFYFKVVEPRVAINQLKQAYKPGLQNVEARIMDVKYTDFSPIKAHDIVAAAVDIYRKSSVEQKNRSNEQQLKLLNDLVKEYGDSVRYYESRIQQATIKSKSKDIDTKLSSLVEGLSKLLTEKQELNRQLANYMELEQAVLKGADLKDYLKNIIFIQNAQVAQVLSRLNELQVGQEVLDLNDKRKKTTPQKTFDIRVENIRKQAAELIKAFKDVLRERLNDLQAKIQEAESEIGTLPTVGTDLNRITRMLDQYIDLYKTLIGRRIEIKISEAGVVPDFIILMPPTLAAAPLYPIKYQIYVISTIAGLLLSLGLIVVRYLLNDTIANQADLERVTNAPILGLIPVYKREKMKYTRLIVNRNPRSAINESLRSIRTNLEFMLPTGKGLFNNTEGVILSVTSTISGEGKTFVSTNLAGIIAMSELKVLVMDFDMRKPKLNLAFDLENDHGVSSVLIGKKNIEECIQKTEIKTLDVVTSGPTPPNPSELILREDFLLLLDNLRRMYDVIIIDTPPVGLVTDGILIMKRVDLPVYVLRANYSKKIFGKGIGRLMKANNFSNMAVILNSVERGIGTYGGYGGYYGGYYGKYYGGGSGYYDEDSKTPKTFLGRLRNLFKKSKKTDKS